jgi:HlyD family secretion protein
MNMNKDAPTKFEKSKLKKVLSNRRTIAVLLVILVLLIWQLVSYNRSFINVDTVNVSVGELVESVSAPGEITARDKAILALPLGVKVSMLPVTEGDFVQKGQIVARLDSSSLYQSYLQAEADLRKTQATLDKVYDEIKDNEKDESFAQREARTAAESAKDRAYRSLVIASENLQNATIRSPISGLVADISDGVSVGANLPPNASILVVNPDTAVFEAAVNEINISQIYVDQKATTRLDAFPADVFTGTVLSTGIVARTTTTGATAYPVQISLPGTLGSKFRLGMNGDVELIIQTNENVLLVPATSVVEKENETYVWAIKNGVANKVNVQTGLSSINEIEIISGVNEGDSIIVRPPRDIKEGARIRSSK